MLLTAYAVRRDESETGLWALVAASLLASPLAWHNYLVLLGPGILLLLSQGKKAPALFLLVLQSIPPQWPDLWKDEGTTLATLALTLYLYILIAHWLAFLTHNEKATKEATAPGPDQASWRSKRGFGRARTHRTIAEANTPRRERSRESASLRTGEYIREKGRCRGHSRG